MAASVAPNLPPGMAEPEVFDKSLEEVFRESLLPAIENGRLDEVRAILQSFSRHDSLQQEHAVRETSDGCESDDGEETDDSDDEDEDKTGELVNLICPRSRKSALYITLELGLSKIAQELLNHGAYADFEWRDPSVSATNQQDERNKRCLDVAVARGSVEMVDALMNAGARVLRSTWQCWCDIPWHNVKEKQQILARLYRYGRGKAATMVPMAFIIDLASKMRFGDGDLRSMTPVLNKVRWYFSAENFFPTLDYLSLGTQARFLIRHAAVSLAQHCSKCFFLQRLLLNVVLCGSILPEAESLLATLLAEGASIHGWTNKHARVMQRAWQYIRLHPEMWNKDTISEKPPKETVSKRLHLSSYQIPLMRRSCADCLASLLDPLSLTVKDAETFSSFIDMSKYCKEFSLSTSLEEYTNSLSSFCILPAIFSHVNLRTQSIKEKVFSRTNVKWLKDPSRIPVFQHERFGLKLHNGPTCSDHVDLSAEQKKVSLAMCTCSGSTVQSLMSLCRDVITTACLEHTENVFFAVENLPLPSLMKYYLLSN